MLAASHIILDSPYDSSAVEFFGRAGVTDPVGKRQVSDFVRGIKSLGLWNSMMCWPKRLAQSTGSGTVLHALGGLHAPLSGTLTNGPTWGADGITFATDASTGRNRNITVTWSASGGYDIRSNSTVMSVSNFGESNSGANFDQFLFGGGASANGRYGTVSTRDNALAGDLIIKGPVNIGNVDYATVSSQTLTAGTWRLWSSQRENNSVGNTNVQGNRLFRDTTQIANGSNAAQVGFEAIGNASDVLIFGNGRGNTSFAPVGAIALTLIFSDWTVSVSTIRDLLKSTLCVGLLT